MKTFKQYITELFDKEYNFGWKIESDRTLAKFNIKGKQYEIIFKQEGPDLEVHFNYIEGGEKRTDITGTGDQFEVFSRVMNATKQFLETKDNIDTVYIGANKNEESRVKLYKKLIKKAIREFGKGWEFSDTLEVTSPNDGNMIVYKLTKDFTPPKEWLDADI